MGPTGVGDMQEDEEDAEMEVPDNPDETDMAVVFAFSAENVVPSASSSSNGTIEKVKEVVYSRLGLDKHYINLLDRAEEQLINTAKTFGGKRRNTNCTAVALTCGPCLVPLVHLESLPWRGYSRSTRSFPVLPWISRLSVKMGNHGTSRWPANARRHGRCTKNKRPCFS